MRCVLFTGKGGVGKTTVAAATATLAAQRGHRTLVVSTDAAHSLADAIDHPVGSEPVEIDTRLWAQQVDTQRAFEASWSQVRRYLVGVLDAAGVDPIEAEELTVLPGADEVLALLTVHDQIVSGSYDLVVVDCAPSAETLRLLALPEALTWYLRRVFPVRRRVARTLRPVLGHAARASMSGESLFDAVERLHAALSAVRVLLTDPETTSVRIVLTPEAVVVAEARRMLTSLSLHGYRADAVVANRLFPDSGADAWRAGWVAAQREQLDEVDSSFGALPILRAAYRAGEPVGLEELAAFGAAAYGELDPAARLGTGGIDPMHVERTAEGFALSLGLPFAERSEVDLARRGDELVVTVGSHRRLLALPSALRRCDVTGASMKGDRLVVSFTPDPDQWVRA
ncbi:MAG: ArsA family ATPase [Frankia sp.]